MKTRDSRLAGEGKPAIVIEARRVEPHGTTGGASDDFTYTVTVPSLGQDGGERRQAPRQRTRLRSGKIVDEKGRFLTECLVHDLSLRGGRLRLSSAIALPPRLRLYDDQSGKLRDATVLWRRDREIGVALRPASADPLSRRIAADMRRKFYAVQD